jgi:hypothetical protein
MLTQQTPESPVLKPDGTITRGKMKTRTCLLVLAVSLGLASSAHAQSGSVTDVHPVAGG